MLGYQKYFRREGELKSNPLRKREKKNTIVTVQHASLANRRPADRPAVIGDAIIILFLSSLSFLRRVSKSSSNSELKSFRTALSKSFSRSIDFFGTADVSPSISVRVVISEIFQRSR